MIGVANIKSQKLILFSFLFEKRRKTLIDKIVPKILKGKKITQLKSRFN
jgi:hypothetical protein